MPKSFISDDDVRKVREATDLVTLVGEQTPVKQRGRDFWCCCPLHNEKTPSFKIDPSTQLWHCFGCGEGGDVFAFVMKTEDLAFPDAVRRLAERAHIEIQSAEGARGPSSSYKARLKECCRATEEFYHLQLMRVRSEESDAARAYLSNRGLGGSVAKTWNLGFAPGRGELVRHLRSQGFSAKEMVDANVVIEGSGQGRGSGLRDRFYNRIMFPIHDITGDCIAFGGRIVGAGEPKYLNSQETPIFHKSQVLYGLDKAKAAMASTGVAVVVEGYTDVIALHEAGLKNTVATLGTALTMQHIRVLSRHAKNRIVYLFDGDSAGQRAADRALQFIDASMTPEAGRQKVELCAVTLPDDLDPADFVSRHGADALRECIEHALPLLQYGIDRRMAAHDLSRPEGRSAAFADAIAVLAPIKDSLLAKDYAVQIAGRTRMREDDALKALSALRPPKAQMERDNRRDASDGHRADEPDGSMDDGPAKGAAHQSGGRASAASSAGYDLPPQAQNRLRHEQELLCLCAQNPSLAHAHAGALVSIQWHHPVYALVADSMIEYLTAHADAQPAELIGALSAEDPAAAKLLTRDVGKDVAPDALAAYLAEELQLGDLEDSVEELKARMNGSPGSLSTEEFEQIFQMVVALQKDLTKRRAACKPPYHER